jgi:hypothetical protein
MGASIIEKRPLILGWIDHTLQRHGPQAKLVAACDFPRLPLYFSNNSLNTTKMIVVDQVPIPPLSALGLGGFGDFEKGNYDGITYKDTFFVNRPNSVNESLIFHEVVHVIQWGYLGAEKFLTAYAMGLIEHGYYDSPLEVMARTYQARFDRGITAYDVEKEVRYELDALVPSVLDKAFRGEL